MPSTTTNLICSNFTGIKKKDAIFSDEVISASDIQNVELFFTGLNSGVGIRTVLGNKAITDEIPFDEKVIGAFEGTQNAIKYDFIYTEKSGTGKVYLYNIASDELTLLISFSHNTGKCCFVDYAFGNGTDWTIFTNGIDFCSFELNAAQSSDRVRNWNTSGYLVGTENEAVSGLGLVVFNSRLWIFNKQRLWYSVVGTCYDFNNSTITSQDPSVITRAGFIDFTKNITAIHEYLGALAVFHSNSSVLVKVDSSGNFSQEEESPGGCASYNSLVFHNTDLFFYDDSKKGIFAFQQVVSGEKTLGSNIAYDIQDFLNYIDIDDIDKIRTLSVFTEDRNEVWFLLPVSDDENYSTILIFDYVRNAWVRRKCQKIYGFAILRNQLYSLGNHNIYEEYNSKKFNGEFIPSFYSCSPFNLGVDNTFKITKFPPRLTVDNARVNDFYVKYIRNYNMLKAPKIKHITAKSTGNILRYDSGDRYDDGNVYIPRMVNAIVKMSSSTFKTIQIEFFTQKANQGFCIKNIEFSKIKVKQV